MNFGMTTLVVATLFSVPSLAQSELMIKKFRYRKHSSANFERLVLEFAGPAVQDEVEVKTSAAGKDQDVSLICKNTQLVGAIPESSINESLQKIRKWLGPLSINSDMPKNGFSLRTLLKNPEAQVDAFWLAQPTRLVVDVYPKNSPRANSRNLLEMNREFASEKRKSQAKSRESIYCFPSTAKMGASVAFAPWKGSNLVPLDVKDSAAAKDEMKEGVVCYPAQSRLHPQVSFANGEMEKSPDSNGSPAQSQLAPENNLPLKDTGRTSLLPPMEKSDEARALASESTKPGQFDPKIQNKLPPSLGANFEKAQKGANPASLLPPFR